MEVSILFFLICQKFIGTFFKVIPSISIGSHRAKRNMPYLQNIVSKEPTKAMHFI